MKYNYIRLVFNVMLFWKNIQKDFNFAMKWHESIQNNIKKKKNKPFCHALSTLESF